LNLLARISCVTYSSLLLNCESPTPILIFTKVLSDSE